MAHGCIYQLIYLRHKEMIFWASFIQICEVYTDSPLSVLLLYHHSIGQPFRVKNLLNSPCLLKLHHLVPNSISVLLGWVLRWLLFGSNGWVNI